MKSRHEILDELRRELDMRESVYPKWIMQDKLSQRTADHRIICIREAIELIEALPDNEQSTEQTQLDLFE